MIERISLTFICKGLQLDLLRLSQILSWIPMPAVADHILPGGVVNATQAEFIWAGEEHAFDEAEIQLRLLPIWQILQSMGVEKTSLRLHIDYDSQCNLEIKPSFFGAIDALQADLVVSLKNTAPPFDNDFGLETEVTKRLK